jgi:hypothetical protein
MKTKLLLLLCFLYSTSAVSQELLHSRQGSVFTYLYQLTNEEAGAICRAKTWKADPGYFHTLRDSFPSDSAMNLRLPAGHYLQTRAVKGELVLDLLTVQHFDLVALDNNADLCIAVYDTLGRPISDAALTAGGRRLPFDQKTQSYRLPKANKKGFLSVTYGGLTAYYDLDRRWNNPRIKQIVTHTPLRYVYRPVRYVVRSTGYFVSSALRGHPAWPHRRYSRKPDFSNHWRGYLVFNKPMYQPGDTVKLKAFIVHKNGKALDDSVTVALYKDRSNFVTLGRIAPYSPGGFDFAFPLHDSLNLLLDRTYTIALQKENDRKYLTNAFRYEDYELKSNALALRTDGSSQFRGQAFQCYLKGTDENDLNLLDARAQLRIISMKPFTFHAAQFFLPDTLWTWEQSLDPIGETAITIPDSIFPPADLSYRLTVTMLTSDNERVVKEQLLSFFHTQRAFHFELLGDSIRFEYRENGESKPSRAIFSGVDPLENRVEERLVQLPFSEKINPYFAAYLLDDGQLQERLNLIAEPALLRCLSNRSADSLYIRCDNPRNIPFRYFLYRYNREIERGYGTDLRLDRASGVKETYFINLQYLWAGRIRSENYAVTFHPNKLKVDIDHPVLVYPGQKTDITVTVTDQRGRPVKGVDLTAYGLTQKFQPNPPSVPSYEKKSRGRQWINSFSLQREQAKARDLLYRFPEVFQQAGLDTSAYYRFLFPGKEIFHFAYPAPDSIAQFAPFVVKNGQLQTVQVVYVDQKPVYFGWSNNYRPYSFRIGPGRHRISIRTTDMLVELDSRNFQPFHKHIFSLSDSVQAPGVRITPMPGELTHQEKDNLYRYIFPYRYNSYDRLPHLDQPQDNIIALWPELGSPTYTFFRLAGPVMPHNATFRALDGYEISFVHEPFMEYEFAPGLLKMRSKEPKTYYPKSSTRPAVETLNDLVLTPESIQHKYARFGEAQRRRLNLYSNPEKTLPGKAKLSLGIDESAALNTILLKREDHSFIRVFGGCSREFPNLDSGQYRVIYLFPEAGYAVLDSIVVKGGGFNYAAFGSLPIFAPDSFSTTVHRFFEEKVFRFYRNDLLTPAELVELRKICAFYDAMSPSVGYYSNPGFVPGASGYIFGIATDRQGEPLIGANVVLKSFGILVAGAVTDFDGEYRIYNVPPGIYDIEVQYVGFATTMVAGVTVEADKGSQLDVVMEEGVTLEAVVVTAYSVPSMRQDMAVAVSSEQILRLPVKDVNAIVANVAGTSSFDEWDEIQLKGSRSDATVYFLDGIRVQGALPGLSAGEIERVEVIEGAEAMALYGPDAAGGAVLITTKAGARKAGFDAAFLENASEARSIRRNFSDYAFWQPRLRTDEEGKATFPVTFPDDITRWRVFVPAMNGKKQSGLGEGSIRSFKPVAARLSLPRFLVEGDTAFAIGKALNYTADTLELRSTFEVNQVKTNGRTCEVADAVTDSVLLSPLGADTLSVQFSIEKSDGYFDGELRQIPVFPKGLERAIGQFFLLDGDTAVSIYLPDSLGEVTLYARADLLDVLEEDLEYLINYEYACNEQLASRLRALLAQERIAKFRGTAFKGGGEIGRIIARLENHRNGQGLWGWWNRTHTAWWISRHVLESLAQARSQGYQVEPLPPEYVENAVWTLESAVSNPYKLQLLQILSQFGGQVDFAAYLQPLARDTTLSAYDRFLLMELQQQYGLAWERDTLAHYQRQTMLGNVYFSAGEEEYHPFHGDLQLTLSAFRIMKRDTTASQDMLRSIRHFLLEYRGMRYRLNTFEAAQIVDALLAGGEGVGQAPGLTLSGPVAQTFSHFPQEIQLTPGDTLHLQKTGHAPVYLTVYQRFWDTEPTPAGEHFEVRTYFAGGGETLKAGEPQKLVAEVKVNRYAQYVLIEIPIPAGCSYASKPPWNRGETHREYFKHKTAIFCEQLSEGTHRFELELLPRYTGRYNLNPAKVELMYFPVIQANTEAKRVVVE